MINYFLQFMLEHDLNYDQEFLYHTSEGVFRCHFVREYGLTRLFAYTEFLCQGQDITEEIMNGKGWIEVKEEHVC